MGKLLKEQLTEAIADCERRIEILRYPASAQLRFLGAGAHNSEREIALHLTEHRRLVVALENLKEKHTWTRYGGAQRRQCISE